MTKITRKRLILKATSWRVVSSLIIATVFLVVSGDVSGADTFLTTAIILQTIFYYLHERGWELIG